MSTPDSKTIAIDGGALCTDTVFGTQRVSEEIITALQQQKLPHQYIVYAFATSRRLRQLTDQPGWKLRIVGPPHGWMSWAVPRALAQDQPDVFLALNQALPSRVPRACRIVTISHGLSFHQNPDLYQDDRERLTAQLNDYTRRSDTIVVSSTREAGALAGTGLVKTASVVVHPFGIPHRFVPSADLSRHPWAVFVGSGQPVKRVDQIVQSFLTAAPPAARLILVGPHRSYADGQRIITYPQMSDEQLSVLYRQAAVYLTMSAYESFNLPVLEALSQRCPVIGLESSLIPELRPFCQSFETPEAVERALSEHLSHPDRWTTPLDQQEQLRAQFSWDWVGRLV